MDSQVDRTRPIIGIESRTAQEVFDIMCDRIRSASLALPKVESETWQPIETAPKDAWVLLYAIPNEVAELRPLVMEGRWGQGLRSGSWLLSHSVGPSFKPTHWRPLPALPSTLNTGGTHE